MSNLFKLDYTQHFQTLPSELYTQIKPQGISNPKLVLSSSSCASLIGINADSLNSADTLKLISGQGILSTWNPVAMKYTGHQFGYYNPDLGDGRGVLLAQVKTDKGTLLDLHLKGAGVTPYSRQGDGRAVLRSSIREFLCSEALFALGVPTTRALCVVDSDTPVYRETTETASMIVRVSESHIRFGHFEYCSFTQQHKLLKALCDHVIKQHYPDISDKYSAKIQSEDKDFDENKYAEFYRYTLQKTAKLMAQWQSVGFNHGVMNTDNMSIIGDTFDFGPFAFLDDYDPAFICNHSDNQGRYAFNQQPNIANWNLAVLAQALLPLVSKTLLVPQLNSYPEIFSHYFLEIMRSKLGLSASQNTIQNNTDSHWRKPPIIDTLLHKDIIDQTLKMMAECRLDFTLFFRQLSQIRNPSIFKKIRDMALDINVFDDWYENYLSALNTDKQDIYCPERSKKMDQVNPKYILRNYLAQNAIADAQSGNYRTIENLHQTLKNPFEEQPEFDYLAAPPPDWGKKLEISCSS
jgi:uncharacterized protein YdiU (UPF0061 family)